MRAAGIPLANAGGLPPIRREVKNSYAGAAVTRLSEDFLYPQTSSDAEIFPALTVLRGRAREMERNNEWVQGYLATSENNVLGAAGVKLGMKVKDPTGQLDKLANDTILLAWADFTKRKNFSVAKNMCFRDSEGMTLRRAQVDGVSLTRIHRGPQWKYGIAFEILEVDRLDINYNRSSTDGGNYIRFGKEFNAYGEVVAYHIFKSHPGDSFNLPNRSSQRERIEAKDIIDTFWSERPCQTLGVTWFAPVMQALEHLSKYREAELVGSRLEACKGYAIETPPGDGGFIGEVDENGRQMQPMAPGMGMRLNPGERLVQITPQHPNTAFDPFVKSNLRGVASGLRTSYNTLSSDYESANYSSMRAAKLEEVEEYKAIQEWLIESYHQRVFEEWLLMALAAAAIKLPSGSALPISKFDKFNAADWKPRRWPWVDPVKDAQAAIIAIEKGLKSRQQIIAEMGDDINEVFLEQEADNALAKQRGLEFPLGTNPQPAQSNQPAATAET